MTLVVLCDGGLASIKAIGWAAVPGFIMKRHDGEQLILVHVWNRDSLPKTLASRDSPERQPQLIDDATAHLNPPPSLVISRTLEAITESKVTRDSLNYKLESMVVFDPLSASSVAPTPQVQVLLRSSVVSKKSLMPEQQQPPQAAPKDEELEAMVEEEAQKRANTIAQYAHERALHHKAEAILLGCGNNMEGKVIIVGHVGRVVLRTMRQAHALWFIKSNGHTLRPNTAVLRYVVILVPRPGIEEDDEGLERDCRVVHYALGLRRENRNDTVSVVVISEGRTLPEKVERYAQVLRSLLQQATSVLTDAGSEGDREAGLIMPGALPEEEAEKTVASASHEVVPVAATDDDDAIPIAATATADADATNAVIITSTAEKNDTTEEQQWPEVSTCQLRPTKHVTDPTVANVPGQVVKFLQRHKTDVVVTPSTDPEEFHMALLAMPKQHVLVVPSVELPCRSELGVENKESPVLDIICTE